MIKRGEAVTAAVNQHVFVAPGVLRAALFDQFISVEQTLRNRRNPHEGFRIAAEQFKLAGALKDENAAGDVVG